jgi:hypothetical protein
MVPCADALEARGALSGYEVGYEVGYVGHLSPVLRPEMSGHAA